MLHFPLRILMLFACAFAILPRALPAQDKTATDQALPIGLLNIEKLAQQHKPFLMKVAALQEEAKELQTSAALKQTELEAVRSELQKAPPNSQEFQRLQNQFGRLSRELQTFVQEGQQKFRDKDLKLSLSLHREIEQVLKPYCKAKGLKLVVRAHNNALDESQNAQQILQALNRGVLYEEGLDITGDVLKLLAEKGEKGNP